jgi:hypothetical protein
MEIITIILLIIVIIILVIYFINEYLVFSRTKNKNRWPPWGRPLPCPDYWVHVGNNICVNPHKQGTGYPKGSKYIDKFDMKTLRGCLGRNQNNKLCLRSKCNFAQVSNNPWFGVQPNCVESGRCYCPN